MTTTITTRGNTRIARLGRMESLSARLDRAWQSRNVKVKRADAEYLELAERAVKELRDAEHVDVEQPAPPVDPVAMPANA